jgi:hypothetical protein
MKHGHAIWGILFFAVFITGYLASAEEVTATRQIVVRFEPVASGAGFQLLSLTSTRPKAQKLSVIQQKFLPEAPPVERHPQLSEEHLVVKGLDAQGKEIARMSFLDPRFVRAETLDTSGQLTTQSLYQESVEFVIALPYDPRIESIEIFQPRWTGTEFLLEPLGKTPLD